MHLPLPSDDAAHTDADSVRYRRGVSSMAVTRATLSVRALLLRVAHPVSPLSTDFQHRCVQQALFMMMQNEAFSTVWIEMCMALERNLEFIGRVRFPVLLGAINARYPIPKQMLQSVEGRTSLVHAVLLRAGQLIAEYPNDEALVGAALHFFHSRECSPRQWYLMAPQLEALSSKQSPLAPSTWLALFNALAYTDAAFDRHLRELVRRFSAVEAPSCLQGLSAAQLHSMIFALSRLYSRLPPTPCLVTAACAALVPRVGDLAARQLVGCLFSCHKAAVYEPQFINAVVAIVVDETATLTDWEIAHLLVFVIAVPKGIAPSTLHAVCAAAAAEIDSRKEQMTLSPYVASLHRLVSVNLGDEGRSVLQRLLEGLLRRYAEEPASHWRSKELRQISNIISTLGMSRAASVTRFITTAETVLSVRRRDDLRIVRSFDGRDDTCCVPVGVIFLKTDVGRVTTTMLLR